MNRGRWGYYPCPYVVFLMLKALNQRVLQARRHKGAWERWARKAPHNRVIRRKDGLGVPEPLPEPLLDPLFCRKVALPSGKQVVELLDHGLEEAYRQARHPKPSDEEVRPLSITDEKIASLYRQACGERQTA